MILVTGFDSFPGVEDNPTKHLARAMDGQHIAGVLVRGVVLEVTYQGLSQRLRALEEEHQPALILGMGVSSVARVPTVELLGVNEVSATLDAAGRCPETLGDGPASLAASLPHGALVKALAGVTSTDAGRYVCNAWLYTALRDLRTPALFLHVPKQGIAAPTLRAGIDALWRETRSAL